VFAASVKAFLKKAGLFAGRTTIGNAKSFLFNCKMHVDNPQWHTTGLIGTDFRSKQILLMLHIWMIHKRLLMEGKEGLAIQEAGTEAPSMLKWHDDDLYFCLCV